MRSLLRYYLPVLLWGAVVTLLSGSEFASSITYRWVRAVARLFDPDISAAALTTINAVVRKLAHVSEFFVLGLLVWRALRRDAADGWRWGWALGTLGAGLLMAAIDEVHQLFERNRGGSVLDVGWDSLGIVVALVTLYAWGRTSLQATEKADPSLRSG